MPNMSIREHVLGFNRGDKKFNLNEERGKNVERK